MKTDDLISMLASDPAPIRRGAASRRIALTLTEGIALATLAMLFTMGLRPDLTQAMSLPMFWLKLAFPILVAGAGFAAMTRLARPGTSARAATIALALPILALWLMALNAYLDTPPAARSAMLWGGTWQLCTASIVLISVPIFAASFHALRQFAPTRLVLAGAFAGGFSGAAGAAIYALHCIEMAMPFLAIWYVAAMAVTAAIGAALGPRLLRW